MGPSSNDLPENCAAPSSDGNVGITHNGLRTLNACRGKYIAFCEGDDYWQSPHKLQKQVDYLENHPECGLVFTDYDFYYNTTGRVVRSVNKSKGYHAPFNLTIEQAIGPEDGVIRTCTIMVRKNIVDQVIEGDPSLHQNEKFLMGDTQLFAESTVISAVSYYPESMATYRRRYPKKSRVELVRQFPQTRVSYRECGIGRGSAEEEKDIHVGRMASVLWSSEFDVTLSSSSRSFIPQLI